MRITATVPVFALLGPPIGGFSAIAMLDAISLGVTANPADLAAIALFGLLYGAAMGYLVGVAPAVGVGLVIALWQEFVGHVNFAMALGVVVVAGLAFVFVIARDGAPNLGAGDFPQMHIALVLTCVILTIVCWLVVRTRSFRPPAAERQP